MFCKIISNYIKRLGLLDADETHLVAVSGGADSVALTLVLLELGYKIEVAHCNFNLRGAESDRDEEFVRTLCRDNGIPFHLVHFNTIWYAELHKISIELAARNLRYAYFRQLCKDLRCADICVAHHRDDNVETVLMNLVRGTGIHGLAGIQPRNGDVKRPLLCVSRKDIESYLTHKAQKYVTDSTNLVDEATRNKFRLNVLPMLTDINPNVADNINRTAIYLSEAVKVFDCAIKDGICRTVKKSDDGGLIINIDLLMEEPSPEYLLHEILTDYGFSASQIGNILSGISGQAGKVFDTDEFELLIDRKEILVERKREPMKPMKLYECGNYVLSGIGRLVISKHVIDDEFNLLRQKNLAYLDAEKIKFPLTLRTVATGDKFIPFGMKGTKLVSDYLTDAKKTLFQKRRQMVVTDASGNIVWLVNERPDNRYRISEHTRIAIRLSFEAE